MQNKVFRPRAVVSLLLLLAVLGIGIPAFAQVDLTGVWGPPRPYEEDEPERGPGPSLVEFMDFPSTTRRGSGALPTNPVGCLFRSISARSTLWSTSIGDRIKSGSGKREMR